MLGGSKNNGQAILDITTLDGIYILRIGVVELVKTKYLIESSIWKYAINNLFGNKFIEYRGQDVYFLTKDGYNVAKELINNRNYEYKRSSSVIFVGYNIKSNSWRHWLKNALCYLGSYSRAVLVILNRGQNAFIFFINCFYC